jgi:hypothetical protein
MIEAKYWIGNTDTVGGANLLVHYLSSFLFRLG